MNSSGNVDVNLVLLERHNCTGHTLLGVKDSIDKERNRYLNKDRPT